MAADLPPVSPSDDPSRRPLPPEEPSWEDTELSWDGPAKALPAPMERRIVAKPQAEAAAAEKPDPFAEAPPDGPAAATPGQRARFERKSGDGTKPFTRFITRPETTVAADLASERAPVERVIPTKTSPTPAFGKLKDQHELEYRSSRLQNVLDETWAHSRLGWLDQLGRLRAIIGGVVIGLVALVLVWPYLTEVLRKREIRVTAATAEVTLPPDDVRQAAVRRAFESYRSADSIDKKLPWVLDPARVELRMRDFYETRGEKDPELASFEVGPPVRAGAEWWFLLTCRAAEGGETTVVMKETPEGGRIDWENFTAYGAMPWDKFVRLRKDEPQAMRVRLRRSTQYAGKYNDQDYQAFEISHRGDPAALLGYVSKTSRAGQQLAAEPDLNEWKPMNLYLSWASETEAPGVVLIGDLIRNNWLDALTATNGPGPSKP